MLIYYALKYLLIKSHGVTRQNLRSKNPDWIRTLWQVFFYCQTKIGLVVK